MSGFKRFIASVADDVRHKVVEEGWFGKQTTGNINEPNTPNDALSSGIKSEPLNDFYGSTRTDEPSAQDLYGNLPGVAEINPEGIDGYTGNSISTTEIDVPDVPNHSSGPEHEL